MSDSGWNTIDSDAGVFTELVEKLDISNVQIDDLYSIDSDSLKSNAPVYGVIFLFKYSAMDRKFASEGNKPILGTYDEDYKSKNIFFANQTIQNACGTLAVLNVLLNAANNKEYNVQLGNELNGFKEFVTGFDSEMVGETISNSDLIRSVHNSFSPPSSIVDESKPMSKDDDDDGIFHFVGYLRINGYIYELDGLKSFPIKHCECKTEEDFYETLPKVLRERIELYNNEMRFSLLVVTSNKLEQAKALGDDATYNAEIMKRETWKRENQLRKHDYPKLIIQLLKNIGAQCNDKEWNQLIEDGKKKSQERLMASSHKS